MAKTSDTSRPTEPTENDYGRPDVIVEFLFENGNFHIAVRNIGERPALGVSIKFNRKFTGVGGRKSVSEWPLFQNIEFLGPGRDIKTFLDTSDSYFRRKQPTKISAQITYRDTADRKYDSTINHDLEIYRDLLYLPRSEDHCGRKPD